MNQNDVSDKLIHLLNDEILPFSSHENIGLDYILNKIGDARLVLMGEATHGTAEFYQTRVELSKRLILEKNFHAIAIEGDWTSTYGIQEYIQGQSKASDPVSALDNFKRFPEWMWRNKTIPPFLKFLREHNERLGSKDKIGFYGLDLYCLNEAMEEVLSYLAKNDPSAAKIARQRYACFDHTGVDPQMYGYLIDANVKKSCVKEVAEQFMEVQHFAFERIRAATLEDKEALFYATQNARVVKNAEQYYRGMFESRENTWNLRDQHMADTLENLISHLETKMKQPSKIIIWAHNSHVGDARATEMSSRNELNLGQLVRERFNATSFHLGFSTYSGTVTAASEWGRPGQVQTVRPGIEGTYEALFHQLHLQSFILPLHGNEQVKNHLKFPRLQRAIGVVYCPDTERFSHYFFTKLPYQFDALIHLDKTQAVEPL